MTKDFDFKADKPSWPLSSYGPAKNEKNLLSSLDESSEELRFKAVTAARNGNINEYVRCSLFIYSNDSLTVGETVSIRAECFHKCRSNLRQCAQ